MMKNICNNFKIPHKKFLKLKTLQKYKKNKIYSRYLNLLKVLGKRFINYLNALDS